LRLDRSQHHQAMPPPQKCRTPPMKSRAAGTSPLKSALEKSNPGCSSWKRSIISFFFTSSLVSASTSVPARPRNAALCGGAGQDVKCRCRKRERNEGSSVARLVHQQRQEAAKAEAGQKPSSTSTPPPSTNQHTSSSGTHLHASALFIFCRLMLISPSDSVHMLSATLTGPQVSSSMKGGVSRTPTARCVCLITISMR